jgi:small redox-active disulfide protein 2
MVEAIMEITLLGPGCLNCLNMERTVFDALAELDVDAGVNVVRDAAVIAGYGVPGMPALLINGKLILYGRVPHKEEMKKIILDSQ